MLSNSVAVLAQTEPEEIKVEGDKFQDFFYESLFQKSIENYDKSLAALEQCLKLKPNDATVYFELGKNYLHKKTIKMPMILMNMRHKWILITNGFG